MGGAGYIFPPFLSKRTPPKSAPGKNGTFIYADACGPSTWGPLWIQDPHCSAPLPCISFFPFTLTHSRLALWRGGLPTALESPLVNACELWVFAMCPALRGSTVSYAGVAHFPKHSIEYSLNFWSQSKKRIQDPRCQPSNAHVHEVHEGHNPSRDARQATLFFTQQTFSRLLFFLFRCPSGVAVSDTA